MRQFRPSLLVLAGAAALLAACASGPQNATVQVFANQSQFVQGSTYRFERLPSQAGQPRQAELEAAAGELMARAGFRRDDANARIGLQITPTQELQPTGYGPAYGSPSVGIGIGGGGGGGGIGFGFGFPLGGGGAASTSHRVDVQMRDLSSGQVVFQSQASGPAGAGDVALLQAALRDFPNAPAGARQVPLAPPAPR